MREASREEENRGSFMNSITTTHKGETIIFNEHADFWCWGTHSHASLAKIKALIDNAQKTEFTNVDAFAYSRALNGDNFPRVTVTSRADDESFWVKTATGKREKVSADRLWAVSTKNEALIAQSRELLAQANELQKQSAALLKGLTAFSVEEAEENAGVTA